MLSRQAKRQGKLGGDRLELLSLAGAIVIMGIWTNLSGYGAVFLEPSNTNASFELMRYAYYGGAIASSLFFLVAARLISGLSRAFELCLPLLMSFSTLCYALAYNQTLLNPLLLGGGASFTLGFCYLWTVATLYITLAQTASAQRVVTLIIGSQVAEQLASVITTHLLTAAAQIAVCFLCPLAAFGSLLLARRQKHASPAAAPLRASFSRKARLHTYLLQASSGIAIVAMGAASSVGNWGSLRTLLAATDTAAALSQTALACLLLVGLTTTFLLPLIERPLSYRYQPAFLVIAASITLASLQPSLDPTWLNAFDIVQSAIEFFSHIMLWVVLSRAIGETGGNPYFLAGVSLAPYSVLSLIWIALLEASAAAPSFVLVFVSYLLILIVAVHPRLLYERDLPRFTSTQELNEYALDGEPEIPIESNGASVVELIERRCCFVGQRCGLSAREAQVLTLLAQGRSRPVIQKQLVLSEGTVKTHLSHIYEKLHVRSAQEALDLIYGGEESPLSCPHPTSREEALRAG